MSPMLCNLSGLRIVQVKELVYTENIIGLLDSKVVFHMLATGVGATYDEFVNFVFTLGKKESDIKLASPGKHVIDFDLADGKLAFLADNPLDKNVQLMDNVELPKQYIYKGTDDEEYECILEQVCKAAVKGGQLFKHYDKYGKFNYSGSYHAYVSRANNMCGDTVYIVQSYGHELFRTTVKNADDDAVSPDVRFLHGKVDIMRHTVELEGCSRVLQYDPDFGYGKFIPKGVQPYDAFDL